MDGPDNALTPEQEVVAAAVASGMTYEQAGVVVGKCLATVKNWMGLPHVRARRDELRRRRWERTLDILANAAPDAASQIHLISTDGESESNRLKASRDLLELGLKYRDGDLAERVARLEQQRESKRAESEGKGGNPGSGGG